MSEPLTGWRHVEVTKRRRKQEFVQQMQALVDEHYTDADCIRVVLDNLDTHKAYAFYEFLPPNEAHRLLSQLEFHFTPVHGSWLNMAEIEFSALATECLDRRIPDAAILRAEVAAWERTRNTMTPPSTGSSPPPMHASNSDSYIQQITIEAALVSNPVGGSFHLPTGSSNS